MSLAPLNQVGLTPSTTPQTRLNPAVQAVNQEVKSLAMGPDSFKLSGAKAVKAAEAAAAPQLSPVAKAVSEKVGRPFLPGNNVSLFIEGKESFSHLYEMINGAKKQINMEYFTLHNDETGRQMVDTLKRKANEGVEVNVLLDWMSNHKNPMLQELKDSGVNVQLFTNGHAEPELHLSDIVDHRKQTLVDGAMGMSGGMNIGTRYEKFWHDDMFKVEGPVLGQYYEQFHKNWEISGGESIAKLPIDQTPKGKFLAQVAVTNPKSHEVKESFLAAFEAAQRSIHVNSPYFIDEDIVASLERAAARGIPVQVEIPTVGDNPAVDVLNDRVHERLEAAGAKVHRFDTKNPNITGHNHEKDHFDHAKVAVVDDWAAIGTANMDTRSMAHNQEFNIHVDDPEFAQSVREKFFSNDFKTFAKAMEDEQLPWYKKLVAPVLEAGRRFL